MSRHNEMPVAPPIAAIWPKLSASCLQGDARKLSPAWSVLTATKRTGELS
jgi:hypothetical protein